MGKWKGIRQEIGKGNLHIRLFDLENDLQEQKDVSVNHPEIVKKMEAFMLREHIPAIQKIFKMKALWD